VLGYGSVDDGVKGRQMAGVVQDDGAVATGQFSDGGDAVCEHGRHRRNGPRVGTDHTGFGPCQYIPDAAGATGERGDTVPV